MIFIFIKKDLNLDINTGENLDFWKKLYRNEKDFYINTFNYFLILSNSFQPTFFSFLAKKEKKKACFSFFGTFTFLSLL